MNNIIQHKKEIQTYTPWISQNLFYIARKSDGLYIASPGYGPTYTQQIIENIFHVVAWTGKAMDSQPFSYKVAFKICMKYKWLKMGLVRNQKDVITPYQKAEMKVQLLRIDAGIREAKLDQATRIISYLLKSRRR